MAEVSRNSDGTSIVKLAHPVTLNGETHARVTITAIKGKHMKHAPFLAGASVTIGQLVTFADQLVEPRGALDEMDSDDALAVGVEVGLMLGKRRPTGTSA